MATVKTHKANATQWRIDVLNAMGISYSVVAGKIIYKGELPTTLVSFLVDNAIRLGINTD